MPYIGCELIALTPEEVVHYVSNREAFGIQALCVPRVSVLRRITRLREEVKNNILQCLSLAFCSSETFFSLDNVVVISLALLTDRNCVGRR